MVWTNAPYTTVGGGRRKGKRNRRREEERSLENRWRAGKTKRERKRKRRTNNHTHALFLSFHREAEEEGAGLCSREVSRIIFWESDSGFPNFVTTFFHKGGNRDLVTSPFVIYPLFLGKERRCVQKIFGKFFRGIGGGVTCSDQHRSENQDLHRFFWSKVSLWFICRCPAFPEKKNREKKRKFRVGRNIWIGEETRWVSASFHSSFFFSVQIPFFPSFISAEEGGGGKKGSGIVIKSRVFPHTRFRAKKKIKGKKSTKKGEMWGVRSTKIRKEFGGNKRKRWTEGKTFPFSLTPISRMAGQEKSTRKEKNRLLPSLIGRTS